jgi:hypothetical protein
MKSRLFLIVCIGIMLCALVAPSYQAQAATYYFTAQYLGGGSCGVNHYILPTRIVWSFPANSGLIITTGTYTINDAAQIQFQPVGANMGAQVGSMDLQEVLPPDGITKGLNTYSYSEIDYISADGVAVGGQIIKLVCNKGELMSASIENFGADESPEGQSPTGPTPQPTFVPHQ